MKYCQLSFFRGSPNIYFYVFEIKEFYLKYDTPCVVFKPEKECSKHFYMDELVNFEIDNFLITVRFLSKDTDCEKCLKKLIRKFKLQNRTIRICH